MKSSNEDINSSEHKAPKLFTPFSIRDILEEDNRCAYTLSKAGSRFWPQDVIQNYQGGLISATCIIYPRLHVMTFMVNSNLSDRSRYPANELEETSKSPKTLPGFFLDRNINSQSLGLVDPPLLSLPHLASALMVYNMQRIGRLGWPPQPPPSDLHNWLSEAAATKRPADIIDQQPLNLSYKSDHPRFRDTQRKTNISTHFRKHSFHKRSSEITTV